MTKTPTRKSPNTFVILFTILILIAGLTWIIPGGVFETNVVNGRSEVIPGTYHEIDNHPQGFGAVLMAPIRGFVDAALIIGFVLLVGGVFGILQRTGAITAGISTLARAHDRSKIIRALIIPIFMTIFSLAGAVFGMSEEIIPFIIIFIPLALKIGYDSMIGVAIPFLGAGVGFAGAFLNPFTIGIAQGIAEVPLFSGLGYRFLLWAVSTALAIFYVMRYANRIKKDPTLSLTYEDDHAKRTQYLSTDGDGEISLTREHKRALLVFIAGILVLVWGVLAQQWYIEEIAGLFLITGILVGIVGRLSVDDLTTSFASGAKDLVMTALIIGLARGILIIAKDGQIIDTMLNALSSMITNFHPVVSAQFMFITQTVINFFVPSGSGQAALTMPVMAPLSDLVGVSRQTAVLAYQMGDGFGNMIIPTSAVTMGVLTLADIPWERWAKWLLPLEMMFIILGFLFLIPPHFMGW
ncbi:MAG: putative basic amino acid antiporter YfcC [Candidatus Marinimicrobia bacterium]|nr:putative basic amino acid antiporter YfcC [Candidatus Neomarinimicrobiota bacterium]